MSYHIELRQDISSIIATVDSDFSLQEELQPLSQEIYDILDHSDRPLYYVSVTSGFSLTFEELVLATNALVRGEYPFASHPNFKALILITDDEFISMGAKGMSSDAFGNVQVEIFASLAEAMTFIRSQV